MTRNALVLLLAVICLSFSSGCPLPIQTKKKHLAAEKGIKSDNSLVPAKITFANKSRVPIKVYWIDFYGNSILYQILENGESYEQPTYLTHPWLITDMKENVWHIYYAEEQPKTVEIVAPIPNEK